MRVVVPFDPRDPNSRLSPVLDADQRREFAAAMLADVLSAVRTAGGAPEILSTAPLDVDELAGVDSEIPVTVDDRPLSAAVNDGLADELPTAVVMADLALATSDAVERLFPAEDDVVIAPGQTGGTNALVVRSSGFSVDYHGASYRDHVAAAEAVGASVATVDSFRLAVDVDDPEDLVDVLVHGEGAAAEWLREAGFEVVVRDGDPVVEPND